MGQKAKQKANNQATERPVDRERAREAEYYARKVGITRDEALRIIHEAQVPKLAIVHKGRVKAK
ncbi:hypothetical protein [Mesorhizobium salmacidum]|uniref:DUF3606 domain-containing protein n=1 Tax=Mesorhizobium salmacidum TaxID=3015171 RepID=A0ABU8L2I4_9HYPH